MEIKVLLKKSVCAILSITMLLSCFVFASPVSNAAGSKYSVVFEMETINNADCNDHGNPELCLYGKNLNGTGGESAIFEEMSLDYDYIQKKQTYSFSTQTENFPTRITLAIDFDGGGWRKWEGKFRVKVNDIYVLNDSDARSLSGANVFSHEKKSMEVTIAADKYPVATNCKYTKTPPSTLTVPRVGESMVTTDIAAEVTDQYGVIWHTAPTISLQSYYEGIGIGDGVLSVNSDANSEDGTDSVIKINATYLSLNAVCTVTLVNATYTY